jgi:hypothetical protein
MEPSTTLEWAMNQSQHSARRPRSKLR